jgi:hypothetical protein
MVMTPSKQQFTREQAGTLGRLLMEIFNGVNRFLQQFACMVFHAEAPSRPILRSKGAPYFYPLVCYSDTGTT